jgi:hypothetical protein
MCRILFLSFLNDDRNAEFVRGFVSKHTSKEGN